ncbi:hypothetical protein EDD70_0842 [Hydrogenoanaerobacterium saccharovorans]|uniref:ABC-2 family transporter protein n=1 Tax=Hydrogenoanaerobacterium saccharovorans TaxID=474960 RepID=A0A1H8ABN6_9FIRM|nr:hypothetical protein [Hydrogenoanaerobacterium saccharovorans]RPF48033.1 hypothetical protein EDD70_0842 [Hydrogenoanaerobacterium saccharovorans]SEM68195.1 hypothetical protein SAMN05216180_1249 [Hydrogenoanaerobacterium saccharovorans]
MLGKLMKYEIKATARFFLPLYGALLVLAVINKLFFSFNIFNEADILFLDQFSAIPRALALTLYIAIIIAIFVITAIVMIHRFYKNLLGDEGYLMFTLPVKPWMNIANKLIVSVMWVIISSFITVFSIFILVVNSELLREIPNVIILTFREINTELGLNAGLFILEMGLAAIISIVVNILQIYAAIAIGQLCNSHKLLASFGAYLAINIVLQTVLSVFFVSVAVLFPNWESINPSYVMNMIMIGGIVISAVVGAVFYFVTHYILANKLNLE